MNEPDPVVTAAVAARGAAYAPYSGFTVGAALQAADGRIFVGSNVENASYGLTICAERAALSSAIVAGARRFVRLVVATGGSPPSAPCGACRQALIEFGADLLVEAHGPRDVQRWTLANLLPDRFGPEDLAP